MPTINGYQNGEPIEAVDINQYFLRGADNAIINGDMRVGQRANFSSLTSIADGAYGLDRWVALGSGSSGVGSSGQNVNIQQMNDAPTGGLNSMRMQATTNGLKFGCVQIIENRNIAGIRAGTVTVSFKAKDSAGITDVRCAVLGWSGGADAVTRDVVASTGTPWLSSPPTLAANWSYLNTPVNLNVTNTFASYSVNANVTGNPNNLAVFIWVNSTTHTTVDDLLVTDVQIESGAIATPFQRKTFQEQLTECQRYFEKSYEYPTAIGTAVVPNCVQSIFVSVTGTSTASGTYAVTKRVTPTLQLFSTNTGAVDRIFVLGFGDTIFGADIGTNRVRAGVGTVTTTGIQFHYTANAEL